MEKLLTILKKETRILFEEYLSNTENWAKEQVKRNIERINFFQQNNSFLYKEDKKKYYQEQKFYYNSPKYFFREQEFVNKSLERAKNHYEDSIKKLASRIQKKELDLDNLKFIHSSLGINFNCVITDNEKILKAWTIVASGPIQKPHYRFLIK